MSDVVPTNRNEDGTFLPGVSGNPGGRPKGKKNQITELKQDLEIAVRNGVSSQDVKDVLQKMVELAKEGNVGAGKLVLDKTVTNARDSDDAPDSDGGMVFVIKNVTVQKENSPDDGEIIDVTPQQETE